MMIKLALKTPASTKAIVAVAIALGAVLASLALPGSGHERASAPEGPQVFAPGAADGNMEKVFWHCDYTASRVGVDTGTALACASVFEEVKKEKFGGDFEALLAWWRENKLAEHRALEAASGKDAAGQ